MVQVTPPPQWGENQTVQPLENPGRRDGAGHVAMGHTPVDSEALTEEGISAGNLTTDVAEGQVAAGSEIVDVFHSPPDPAGGQTVGEVSPPVNTPAVDRADEGTLAPLDFQSDRTKRTRQVVLVGMLSVSLFVIAGLLFGQFVRSQAEREPDPAGDLAEKRPFTSSRESSTQKEETPKAAQRQAEEVPATNEETVSDEDQKAAMTPANRTEESAGKPVTEESMAASNPGQAEAEDAGLVREVIPPPLIPTDTAASAAEPAQPVLADLPDSLKQFTPFLLQEDPQPEATLKPLQTIDDIELDGAEEEASELGIQAARKINPRGDLAMRIAMRSKAATLPHLALTFSQITNLPIQIDWVSFDLAGISIERPFKISGKTRPVGQWIEEAAGMVEGEVEILETMLRITPREEAFTSRRDELLDLSDLADPQSAKELVKRLVDQAVPPLDDAADEEVGAGPGRVDVRDGEEVETRADKREGDAKKHQAISKRQRDQLQILATEMLRRMRGGKGKLPDDVIARWGQVRPGDPTEWAPLAGGKHALVFDFPMAAVGVFKRTAKTNQASCFVNWNDANRRGLRPARLVLPTSADTAQGVLNDILRPHLLQVRTVDQTHWWIGSGSSYDRLPVLIQSKKLGDQRARFEILINQIRSNAGSDPFLSVYDSVSDQMLLLMPRYVARQLPGVGE